MITWRKRQSPVVICCYKDLHVETERSVRAYAPGALFCFTGDSPFSYREMVRQRWTGERDLVTIEQDIEITPDVIKSFRKCKKPWCVYSYQGPPMCGYLYRSLGCTRFSAELQKSVPFTDFRTQDMTWQYVDQNIAELFWALRLTPHVHGHLNHHHNYRNDDRFVFHKACIQIEADGRRNLYQNNEDWTRGEFLREVKPGAWIQGDGYEPVMGQPRRPYVNLKGVDLDTLAKEATAEDYRSVQ